LTFFTSTLLLPLQGNRISLISKKNIRSEGILYSINESDATVALQDVKSFGTEGREKTDPSTAFVPPQDAQHAFLVFRGQDIKDLHVHEAATPASEPALPEDPAIISSTLPPDLEAKKKQQETQRAEKGVFDDDVPKPHPSNQSSRAQKQKIQGGANSKKPQEQRVNQSGERRPRKKTDNQVGTGASLLNRKARGVVDGSGTFIFSWMLLKNAHWVPILLSTECVCRDFQLIAYGFSFDLCY